MNHQDELQHFTGEIFEPEAPEEGFEGRYDHEPMLQKWLRAIYQLRMACRAIHHNQGKTLRMNHATNIMECDHCGESWDMNELVSPQLRVNRYGIQRSDIDELKKASNL